MMIFPSQTQSTNRPPSTFQERFCIFTITLVSPLSDLDLYPHHYQPCQVGLDAKLQPLKSLKKQTEAALDPKPHIC